MKIMGLDLSGPSNLSDTVLTCFHVQDGLHLNDVIHGASDLQIYEYVAELANHDSLVVGLDAPLSYNVGGGDRPGDKELRKLLVSVGMPSGSVMTPTFTRMAYLTLRGMALARIMESIKTEHLLSLVEVHPGATMALNGAEVTEIKSLKKSMDARKQLLQWLGSQGLMGLEVLSDPSDHLVASCAAALAAWTWFRHKSAWLKRAEPPFHPYDFAC